MRRFFVAGALGFVPVLLPLACPADTMPAVVYVLPTRADLPHIDPPVRRKAVSDRILLYVLQTYDAVQTAAALRKHNQVERNPMVRPFTRGGVATLVLGFAAGNLARDMLLRRAPDEVRAAANAAQAFANLDGIITTRGSVREP